MANITNKPEVGGLSRNRVVKIVLLAVIFLVLTGLAAFVGLRKNNSRDTQAKVCNDELIRSALPYLSAEHNWKLEPIVKGVREKANYQKDIDCMYIAAVYSLNISDTEQARQDLEKFENLQKNNHKLSGILDNQAKNLEDLKRLQRDNETREKEIQQQVKTFGEPE